MATKVRDIVSKMLEHLNEQGWLSDKGLLEYGATLKGSDVLTAFQARQKLNGDGYITRRSGPAPDNLPGWGLVMEKRLGQKRYGTFSIPRVLTMELQTPSLGQISEDGLNFKLERNAKGEIMFKPAQFRAMLEKAHRLTRFVPDEETGDLPTATSTGRWPVHFLGVELQPPYDNGQALPIPIRRPTNKEGQAVGECRHEALPPGTLIRWGISWPESHYSPLNAHLLLLGAEDVGFSPSGNGQHGGGHGLFVWCDLPEVSLAELQGNSGQGRPTQCNAEQDTATQDNSGHPIT